MSANYSFSITIPANTLERSKQETQLILSPGIIDQISIAFPPGCSALARIQIFERESQLFPQNKGGYYAWDNTILTFYPIYTLTDKYPIFLARTWNLDEFYEHEINLMINIIGEDRRITDLVGLSSMLGSF